jgi:hypothetical protein
MTYQRCGSRVSAGCCVPILAHSTSKRSLVATGCSELWSHPTLRSYVAGMTPRRFPDLAESLLHDVRYADAG